MEEKEIAAHFEEKQRIQDMADRNEIFNCSGTQTHSPMCEGDCGIRVLTPLEIEINEEHQEWEKIGMVPLGTLRQLPNTPGVAVNILKMEVALAALTEGFYELGGDKEKLNVTFQEMYLERLRDTRKMNEEMVIEQQSRQKLAMGDIEKQSSIVLPDYITRKH